ncbi:acyl-CoA dehydrogenase family protein [Roseomonas sp. AR75]|uniref:acyl-CoA dehydrogenase family protein n=1 Tax=Roseomonas sp. AR75 TaxID=2562311 RepID=UPI001F0FE916|nr:acyl-CoA dehydrogenase family protein [Roseomonas sp. AR75]
MTEAEAHVARMDSLRMIRDSAAAVAPPGGDLRRIRALRFSELGHDTAVLQQMGELGWIGLRLPEEAGGIGLGMAEGCALAEEMGRALVPEPLIPAQLSAALLHAAGAEDLLASLLAGERFLATAWQEAPDALDAPGTQDAPRLLVPAARAATGFLLPVREGDALALHLAEPARLDVQALQDGGHVATLVSTSSRRLGPLGDAVGRALDEAALGTAAYLLGAMERAFAITLDYLRTRQQFGRPIGSFQALQHRAVDLRIQIALTRASVDAAAATLDAASSVAQRQAAVSRAKARAAEAAMLVTRAAVQLHGAIGYTDEYDVGLFTRKAMVLANAFGSAALHRRRFLATDRDAEA